MKSTAGYPPLFGWVGVMLLKKYSSANRKADNLIQNWLKKKHFIVIRRLPLFSDLRKIETANFVIKQP